MSTTSTAGVTRIDRTEAKALAAAEFEKFAALTASLTPAEWATDTDCVGWDVRTMVLHVLGSADAQASPLVFLHQLRRGLPLNKEIDSHHWVDGLNELQIRERSQLSNDEVIAQLETVGQKAVKGRFGTPLPMRYVPVPFGDPIGWKPVNYLLEVGFTRDVWAHRIDIHAVIGRPDGARPRPRRTPGRRHRRRVGRAARRAVRPPADRHRRRHVQPGSRAASRSRWTRSTSSAPWPGDFPAPA